jgi:hypothetical protein
LEISGEPVSLSFRTGSAEMKPNRQNGREWRVFHDRVKRALGDCTGWLGRQDSNRHMAESDAGWFYLLILPVSGDAVLLVSHSWVRG